MLRESIGNAVFFSVYEYVRYYMHLQLKPALSDHSSLIDMGIGIVTGGLGGVAVSNPENLAYLEKIVFPGVIFNSIFILDFSSSGLLFCPWTWLKPLSRQLQIKATLEIHF